MKHLTDAELSASLDERLSDWARLKAERHLGQCNQCRDRLAVLADQDRALSQLLAHDPGEAYFEAFPSRVETRLRASGLAGAQSRAFANRAGVGNWLRGPRGLAWAGTVAAVMIGAGVVFMVAREMHVPALLKPELEKRGGQVARKSGAPETPAETRARQRMESRQGAPRALNAGPEQAAPLPVPLKTEAPHIATPQDEARMAQPSRAIEVRRDAHGEEVPVRRPGAFAIAPPAPPSASGEGLRAAKLPPRPLAESPAAPSTAPGAKERSAKAQTEALTESQARGGRATARETLDFQYRESADRLAIGNQPGGTEPFCGVVRDYSGRPVSNAQVTLADVGLTTSTNREGGFCLKAPLGSHMLSVLAVGFEPIRRSIDVSTRTAQIEIELQAVPVLQGPAGLARREAGEVSGRMMLKADSFAGWPKSARELALEAERHMVQAEAVNSAAMFDRAASSWERTLKETRGGDPELRSRQKLAEARFRAWEATPTPGRTAAALEALTSYLVRAPVGAGRDSAIRQLNRIKR